MKLFPTTIILRHQKERLSKCSLRGLEQRTDLRFYTYPWKEGIPPLKGMLVLTLNGPELSEEDAEKGLFLIDGTWRYAKKMIASLPLPYEVRSLPRAQTAYPRRQPDCTDPQQGLASVEALYLAYLITGRNPEGILDHYRFREAFLKGLIQQDGCKTHAPLSRTETN